MAIGQVKTRLAIVDDQQSSGLNLDVDDDADVDVPYNVGGSSHSRTYSYLSATPPVSTLTKQHLQKY